MHMLAWPEMHMLAWPVWALAFLFSALAFDLLMIFLWRVFWPKDDKQHVNEESNDGNGSD